MQALQTATLNPAQVHEPSGGLGNGREAASSRIWCCSTPTRSRTSPTRKKSVRVVLAGRYLDRAELDRMLKGVEKAAAESGSKPAAHGSAQ